MSITRYENIDINNVTNSKNSVGEQLTTSTKWFTTRALVRTPRNSLTITGTTRIYLDVVTLRLPAAEVPALQAKNSNDQALQSVLAKLSARDQNEG